MRNLYNDGIWDVYTINDLDTLKENGVMNVLAKSDDYLMFEAGKDFWKIDFQSGELTQYKDFVSLENNIDGKKVYDRLHPEYNLDYGAVLYDTIQETELKDLPNFSLQQRNEYFENTTKGMVKHSMKGEFERAVEKNRDETKKVSNTLFETIDKPETKPLVDGIQVVLETLAIFYTIFQSKYKQHKKEQLIKDILNKLDNNELDIKDVLNDRILNEKVPELRYILDEWQKNRKRINIDTSITADEALKRQQNGEYTPEEANNLLALPENKEELKLLVAHIVDDPQVNEVAEKLAKTDRFHELRAEQFCKNIDVGLEYEFGTNFKDKIKQAFDKSEETDPINFSYKLFSEEEVIDELKLKHPDMNPKDCGLAVSYLNYVLERGNNVSKNIVTEKFMQNSIKENGNTNFNFNLIFDLIQKVVQRIDEAIKKQQEQGMHQIER